MEPYFILLNTHTFGQIYLYYEGMLSIQICNVHKKENIYQKYGEI